MGLNPLVESKVPFSGEQTNASNPTGDRLNQCHRKQILSSSKINPPVRRNEVFGFVRMSSDPPQRGCLLRHSKTSNTVKPSRAGELISEWSENNALSNAWVLGAGLRFRWTKFSNKSSVYLVASAASKNRLDLNFFSSIFPWCHAYAWSILTA